MDARLIVSWAVSFLAVGCASRPPLPVPLRCSIGNRNTLAAPTVLLARPEIVSSARAFPASVEWGPDDDAALVGARFVGEIEGHYGELTACFDRGRERDAELEGRVSVKLTIAPSGDVVALADGGGTTLPHRGVVGCVQSTFTRMKFAPWEGEAVTAVLPLDFSSPHEVTCSGTRGRLGP